MKHLILILLLTSFSVSSPADQAEINAALAKVTGIWQDSGNNYYSIQSDDNGYLLFLDLNYATSRAIALKNLGLEVKPEYLAFYGKITQENISSNGIGISGDTIAPVLEPLILLKEMYPEHAEVFLDRPVRVIFVNESTSLYICDICSNTSDGGIYSTILYNMTKVF